METIRHDKPWSQCLTVSELREIYKNPVRKPTAEARLAFSPSSATTVQVPALPLSSASFPPPATPASSYRDRKAPRPVRIVDTYRTVDPSTVPVEQNLLQGTEVCVIGEFALLTQSSDEDSDSAGSGSDTNGEEGDLSAASTISADDRRVLSKAEVEKMVLANGGKLTSSPRQGETALVLAPDTKSLRVKLLIKAGIFDVVGLPFLLRCIRQGRLTPPRFGEYLYMTQATRDKMTESVDAFGDPYVEPTTVKTLARCFRHMKTTLPTAGSRGPPVGSTLLIQLLHHDNDPDVRAIFKMPLALFGGCNIYLDRYADLGPTTQDQDESSRDQRPRKPLPVTRLDHLEPAIRLHGGRVSDSLHVSVTHVVIDRRDTERFSLLATRLKQLRRLPFRQVEKRVVGSEWVEACLEAGTLVVPSSSEHAVRLRHTSQ